VDYSDPNTTYTYNTTASASYNPIVSLVWLAFAIVIIVAMWRIYTKAGKPGWAAIVPIYNLYVLTQIVGRPGWWVLLMLIPFVNIVVAFILAVDLAKSFGKDGAFGILALAIFSIVGYPILAFSKATYVGPSAKGGAAAGMTGGMTPPPSAPTPPAQ